MKALVGAFNQEKALVGAFSVIVQPVVELMDRFAALILIRQSLIPPPMLSPNHADVGVRLGEAPGAGRGRAVAAGVPGVPVNSH